MPSLIRLCNNNSNLFPGGYRIQEDDAGLFVSDRTLGTAEEARNRVRAYFDDLRDTINNQEEAGLSVINNFVREKLCSLRQQQEDMAVFMSQVVNYPLSFIDLDPAAIFVPVAYFFYTFTFSRFFLHSLRRSRELIYQLSITKLRFAKGKQ